ncbi:MAG TPA: hypothetical protein VKU01_17955 [Bryobacteraceae bacterium]|nr:hypothetical protein [Bryobacteraceae bacterium]
MSAGSIVRFRPTGPWRFGPDSGSRDRIDVIYHSDSVFSAVTTTMQRLGAMEEWLDATARRGSEPEVRFSSFFPFQDDLLYVTPPRSIWPPAPSPKIRYKGARFVPLSVIQGLLTDQPINEDRWTLDGESQCLIPTGKEARQGPFRVSVRSNAAVDRLSPAFVETHTTACIEFARDAGLWTAVIYSSDEARERWEARLRSVFRLLADSGFGGGRSLGWGRSEDPEWSSDDPLKVDLMPPKLESPDEPSVPWPAAHWLLSVYAPAESDGVDWKTGNYATIQRTGRTETSSNWGALKRETLMISEGSVLVASNAPCGEARDVSPANFPHPVYRAGYAVTIAIPWRGVL